MGAFLAIAIQFALLSAGLYPIVRREFLLWMAARAAMIAVMALTLTSFSVPAWFPPDETLRLIGGVATAASAAVVGPLLASYVERDIRMWRIRRLLRRSFWLGAAAAAAVPFLSIAPALNYLHDFALLGLVGIVVYGLYKAVRMGSRAARYQAVAWSGGIAVSIWALLFKLATDTPYVFWLEAMLLALSLEFLVAAMGVADGFMNIKRERDKAMADVHAAQLANATDPLTGVANRRGLDRHFAEGARGRPEGIAIIDCDHFKTINDRFGHDVGDDVLVAVAQGLMGDDVFIARLGGEEFIALIYSPDWQSAAEAARRRISQAVRERVPNMPLRVTASAGLAAIEPGESLASTMKRADRALYAAKEAGKNRSLALTEFHPRVELKRIA